MPMVHCFEKGGGVKPYNTWREIKRENSDRIVFMDNNVLAHRHGIEQMRSMIGENIKIDFNQGIDARLINPEIAEIIANLRWIRFIRMAADTEEMLKIVLEKVELLGRYGVKPYRIFTYVLVQNVDSAERRVLALREAGVEMFAQPYRDFENNREPTEEQRAFARWVNNKAVFKTAKTFKDYDKKFRSRK